MTIGKFGLPLLGVIFVCWLVWCQWKRGRGGKGIIVKLLLTTVLLCSEGWLVQKLMLHLSEGGFLANSGLALAMVISIVAGGLAFSGLWTPEISAHLISPLTDLLDGGNEPPDSKPVYSAARSKLKNGKPLEAIVAIREQLAKFPNDFEGVFLLAQIQAEDLNDLAGAEVTFNYFCDFPRTPDRQIIAALFQLAEWQIAKSADMTAGMATLQKIVARYPYTQFSLRAEKRIAELILSAADQPDRPSVSLPAGENPSGLGEPAEVTSNSEIEPGKLAAVYVQRLELNPQDTELREKLAVLYANHFQRLDLATLELEQLIQTPGATPRQIADWLNLLANCQIELGANVATVCATLEKIVERFPALPEADLARRRLACVNGDSNE